MSLVQQLKQARWFDDDPMSTLAGTIVVVIVINRCFVSHVQNLVCRRNHAAGRVEAAPAIDRDRRRQQQQIRQIGDEERRQFDQRRQAATATEVDDARRLLAAGDDARDQVERHERTQGTSTRAIELLMSFC